MEASHSVMAHPRTAIACRVAANRGDYRAAFRLLYLQYSAAGLCRPNPTGLRIAPHQLWPECVVIVAEQNHRIVGTVSLFADGPRNLPLDGLFQSQIAPLRSQGLRLLEIGCLAVKRCNTDYQNLAVYNALTRAAVIHANMGEFERMIAAVHPRHCKFYEQGMGFERLSDEVRYPLVEGNRAVCLAGDPNDPNAYRQPWRKVFFGHRRVRQSQACHPMSSRDRAYFASLQELASSGERFDASRAA